MGRILDGVMLCQLPVSDVEFDEVNLVVGIGTVARFQAVEDHIVPDIQAVQVKADLVLVHVQQRHIIRFFTDGLAVSLLITLPPALCPMPFTTCLSWPSGNLGKSIIILC
jgi:hypothetical protein